MSNIKKPRKPERPMTAEEALAWAHRVVRHAQESSRDHVRALNRFAPPPRPRLP